MSRPYIVAGPCSVESTQQLGEVVQALSRVPQVALVRCGVWKPRTHPGGFEGMGEQALQWIAEVRKGFPSLRFGCEVARPEHVELAVQYGMDAVWIGARTTANPFMVQEVTEAMRGSGLEVLVKNAPSPDVQLWMGAVERCRQVGIEDVVAVHRGFDVFKNGGYRNNPLWEVPIELRRHEPGLPLLCDPSHIAGRREPVKMLAQTAMDLGFDGLMVEVHPCPKAALTDAEQQITPADLVELIGGLVVRQTDSSVADEQLHLLREQIDLLDSQLLQTLAARFGVAQEIAEVKERGNLAVYQPKRWESLLQQRRESAVELGMDPDFVKEFFEKIHAESVRVQERRLNQMNENSHS
ncbi:MAG: bifunctional 3-deoxy-7-phosphoheptulonate synthase/chorismate mutase type II [Bacteroidales bacterium]|nr:bifunctional 3-deoxy-7-phosphoheptulonate synthase/chorismate mutase type II [Bacteroidales bacterium]